MHYSSIGLVALLVHIIINSQALGNLFMRDAKGEFARKVKKCYRNYLFAALIYYLVDIIWGFLYECHEIPSLFPLLSTFTVFYFLSLFAVTFTWIRYIIAYLNRRGRSTKLLHYGGWVMLLTGLLQLMLNRFYPFIFSFNEQHEYVAESGRFFVYLIQIGMFAVTALYMLVRGYQASGPERVRYYAVGLATLAIDVFGIHQIFFPFMAFNAIGFLLGTCVIHSFVEASTRKDKETYDNIARTLAGDFEAIFYITLETGEYKVYATSAEHDSLNAKVLGKDFFAETRANVKKYAHPDDQEYAESWFYKDTLLEKLEGRWSFSFKYRIMVGDEARFFLFTVMKTSDDKHLVLCEKDIQDEITAEKLYQEERKRNLTYTHIAESLADNYDVIYYVDAIDSGYTTYVTGEIFGQELTEGKGDDFFADCMEHITGMVHKNDREMVRAFLNRDRLISALQRHKSTAIDFSLTIGGKTRYARMTVRKTNDESHFLICVENNDAEVRKEKKVLKALNNEKELARRDELTGVKNRTAYLELDKSLQDSMDKGEEELAFAIIVCDSNNLKLINDTLGHVAGDEYIRDSAKILCDIFDHSPVFRIGGDEFAVYLTGRDYRDRQSLMQKLRNLILKNKAGGTGPVLASGMAEYDREKDTFVSEVFARADKEMYEDKQRLKN